LSIVTVLASGCVGKTDGDPDTEVEDTGPAVDTGVVEDSDAPIDTGVLVDTGDFGDTGVPLDTGVVHDTGSVDFDAYCQMVGPLSATQLAHLPGANIVGAITDPNGTLYLADQGFSRIIQVDGSGQVTELVTNVHELGVGISELELIGDDLYFAEANTGAIFKVDLTGSFPVDYASLTPFIQDDFNDPGGLTSDAAGNLFISSVESTSDLGYHSKIGPSGALLDLNWSTLEGNWPTLTIDEQDNVYTVEPNSITKTTPYQVSTPVVSGINGAVGLTYKEGCLYFTDVDGVRQYDFTGNPPTLIFAHSVVGVAMPAPTRILVDDQELFTYLSTDTIWRLQ